MKRSMIHAIALLLTAHLLIACQTQQTTPQYITDLASIPYPAAPAETDDAAARPMHLTDLDILVERSNRSLKITNRTPNTYNDVQMWLNKEYVSIVDSIDIGPGTTLSLNKFVNRHRQTFPVGNLLSPDKAFPVVLAELYDPKTNARYRLTVTKDDSIRLFK